MDKFIITGNNRLRGELTIRGAKNAVLPILAACLLSDDTCVIHNVPDLKDVTMMCELLKAFGAKITKENRTLSIDSKDLFNTEAPESIMKEMRASNLVLGPILSRFHQITLPFPGGCAIGLRPMNYHLRALQTLGADLRWSGYLLGLPKCWHYGKYYDGRQPGFRHYGYHQRGPRAGNY